MAIREMNGDPSVWEDCYWDDLSLEEKSQWTALGWKKDVWNKQINIPDSASKKWSALNEKEQAAASKLGFTSELWDSFEDQ